VEPVFEAVDHLENYVVPVVPFFRKLYNGVLMANGNYTPETAIRAIEVNEADMVSFGKLFISNPDLVERIRLNASLNAWDTTGFYGGGEKGYTDYAVLSYAVGKFDNL
jgi:N-ethylmaleimide reductase